ncbi:hypothetical protein TrCOL_g7621 [Triparma columacea]|uniref:Uncharacterized protein n=1 Tax=Triparma columacea TaxID=722753 RepID=A0A9W7LCW2_9STRA|nr:hypothetical protein TrCOL_g7621 [Triparma columacea]
MDNPPTHVSQIHSNPDDSNDTDDTEESMSLMNEFLYAFGMDIPDLQGLIGKTQEEVNRFVGLYTGLLFRNKGLDDRVAMLLGQGSVDNLCEHWGKDLNDAFCNEVMGTTGGMKRPNSFKAKTLFFRLFHHPHSRWPFDYFTQYGQQKVYGIQIGSDGAAFLYDLSTHCLKTSLDDLHLFFNIIPKGKRRRKPQKACELEIYVQRIISTYQRLSEILAGYFVTAYYSPDQDTLDGLIDLYHEIFGNVQGENQDPQEALEVPEESDEENQETDQEDNNGKRDYDSMLETDLLKHVKRLQRENDRLQRENDSVVAVVALLQGANQANALGVCHTCLETLGSGVAENNTDPGMVVSQSDDVTSVSHSQSDASVDSEVGEGMGYGLGGGGG